MMNEELERSGCRRQRHVHEVIGSTLYESNCGDCHNHRFATISGEAIQSGRTHYHEIAFKTDTADGHYHTFCGKSGPAVDVGGGKHVHYAKSCTQSEDGHKHPFQVASLIEEPTEFECERG